MSTMILRFTVRVLAPVQLALSIYLLFRGHNAPGGGFIAALVAGGAVMLQYMAHGSAGARKVVPVDFSTLLGVGLVLAVSMGLAGLVAGEAFLTGAHWSVHAPLIGELDVTASLVFDTGVYLVVLAVIVAVVGYLGEEE